MTLTHPPVTDRDERWLDEVFRTHHRAIQTYAYRRLGDDRADDVVANVFADAWRQRHKVPTPELAWLYRAAHFEVLTVWKADARQGRTAQRLANLADGGGALATSSDHAGFVADHQALRQFLAQLPERDAEILMLTALDDLDPDQIGQVLGCSAATVRVRLHRARRRAKALLGQGTRLPTPSPATPIKEAQP